jgi:hypothetical protein
MRPPKWSQFDFRQGANKLDHVNVVCGGGGGGKDVSEELKKEEIK